MSELQNSVSALHDRQFTKIQPLDFFHNGSTRNWALIAVVELILQRQAPDDWVSGQQLILKEQINHQGSAVFLLETSACYTLNFRTS